MKQAIIRSTPEHGVGQQEMTIPMAANAIFNKLNFALVSVPPDSMTYRLLLEARALADSIVKHEYRPVPGTCLMGPEFESDVPDVR